MSAMFPSNTNSTLTSLQLIVGGVSESVGGGHEGQPHWLDSKVHMPVLDASSSMGEVQVGVLQSESQSGIQEPISNGILWGRVHGAVAKTLESHGIGTPLLGIM